MAQSGSICFLKVNTLWSACQSVLAPVSSGSWRWAILPWLLWLPDSSDSPPPHCIPPPLTGAPFLPRGQTLFPVIGFVSPHWLLALAHPALSSLLSLESRYPWELPSSLLTHEALSQEHLTFCPKEGGSPLGLASWLLVSLCCIQLPRSCCFSLDVLLTICLSILHAEQNVTAAYRERLYIVDQPKKKKIVICLINCSLKVTSPSLLRK